MYYIGAPGVSRIVVQQFDVQILSITANIIVKLEECKALTLAIDPTARVKEWRNRYANS